MKIAVIGSRKILDSEFVWNKLTELTKDVKVVTVLSGGAKGVDTLAQSWAKMHGYDFVLFKPYHLIDSKVLYEPKYFFTRNKQIADNADWVIAFWDGQSSGTRHMIEYCQRKHKKHTIVEVQL